MARNFIKMVSIEEDAFINPKPGEKPFVLFNEFATVAEGIRYIQNNPLKGYYLGFKGTEPQKAGRYDEKGRCYWLKEGINPGLLKASTNMNNNVELYAVPISKNCVPVNEKIIMDCLRTLPSFQISDEINTTQAKINELNEQLYKLNLKNYGLKNNLSDNIAKSYYDARTTNNKLSPIKQELEQKLEVYRNYITALTAASNNANVQLSDKNRLLSSTNTDIKKKFSRLEDVNAQINTITQELYDEQKRMERKEQILKTMKILILILVILLVMMLVYYNSEKITNKYPELTTPFANAFKFN